MGFIGDVVIRLVLLHFLYTLESIVQVTTHALFSLFFSFRFILAYNSFEYPNFFVFYFVVQFYTQSSYGNDLSWDHISPAGLGRIVGECEVVIATNIEPSKIAISQFA